MEPVMQRQIGKKKQPKKCQNGVSKDENQIKEGLKRIKPKYYVIRKDKIENSGVLFAKKTYLDENFKLIKNFKEYLLYQTAMPSDLN